MNPATPEDSQPAAAYASWPYYADDEIAAATRVLASGRANYWTGEEGRSFEKEFAAFTGCRHAVALANGTTALEAALYALGIGPGDEVIIPSRTFIATASCAVVRGATPVVADVHPESQNITAATIEPLITGKTRAVIVVHFAGWPCDMDPIMELTRQRGLKVIEDCAQAHGARYKGRPVGSLGDAAAFSFCQDKILSTGGEGGMLTTDSEEVWRKAWSYKDHGKSYDAVYNREHPPGFRWLHEDFGTNWRLTEMQSAIGRIQLVKLPAWVETRRRHAARLSECFQELAGLRVTLPAPEFEHSYYKYYVFVDPERLQSGWDRDRIMAAVRQEGVPCDSGGCSEIYLEKAFKHKGLGPRERLPVARRLGRESLMFLVHPTLTGKDMEYACSAVAKVMRLASR